MTLKQLKKIFNPLSVNGIYSTWGRRRLQQL